MPFQIKSNPYIKECKSSAFTVLFNNAQPNNTISFIHGMLQYQKFYPNLDLFCYINELESLRKDKNLFFLFDASTEGYSPFDYHFFDILYRNCKKYNVPPKKIIYVSANMHDTKNIEDYNKANSITDSINVFCFLSFKSMVRDLLENHKTNKLESYRYFQQWKEQNQKLFDDKILLSLSRVNRKHRTYAIYNLWKSEIKNSCLLSHDAMTPTDIEYFRSTFNLLKDNVKWWQENLPLIADTTDFNTNHALSLGSHLHNSTLFQIVNETSVDDRNNTSFFYSEKTFKPIAHMQPFLIWGQRGCNKALEKYGFKLYDELFNYDFDNIENTKKRYIALQRTATEAVNYLEKLPREKQLEWRWNCREKLIHNFDILANENNDLNAFRQLYKRLGKRNLCKN